MDLDGGRQGSWRKYPWEPEHFQSKVLQVLIALGQQNKHPLDQENLNSKLQKVTAA